MRKEEFLNELKSKLVGLPKEDIDYRLSFYEEMIDDRLDEGISEEQAVAEIGSEDDNVTEIAKETPLATLVKEKVKPKRTLKDWEIILIIVGFPLWFPVALFASFIVLLAYFLIWIFVIVAYSVEFSLIASSIAGSISFLGGLFNGEFLLTNLGAAMLSGGLAIFLFFGCYFITKATLKLSNKILTSIKAAFIKKGSK